MPQVTVEELETQVAEAIALVEAWLDEEDDESERSLAEFLTFIEENRLDLSSALS